MSRPIELLIPASSLEVLKTAVIFGADAVYIGGEAFGLRAKAKNFSMEEMKEGIEFAHAHDVKVYVTANILAEATWNMQGWLDEMEKLGLCMEDKPYYNDYALYIAMNQVISDHGETIAIIKGEKSLSDINEEELVEYAYKLALDILKDKDGVYNIREYFLK